MRVELTVYRGTGTAPLFRESRMIQESYGGLIKGGEIPIRTKAKMFASTVAYMTLALAQKMFGDEATRSEPAPGAIREAQQEPK